MSQQRPKQKVSLLILISNGVIETITSMEGSFLYFYTIKNSSKVPESPIYKGQLSQILTLFYIL